MDKSLLPAGTAFPGLGRSPAEAAAATGWRSDIQILRGLAVSLVVIEHARLAIFPGGFLGVDIFFVISGYLMTKIILADMDAGRFSFGRFYARRIRRLLPAAYATIIITAVLAPFLLDPVEFANFVQQALGSFAFVVNVVLWKQTDYFGSGAALKPLLHMWSLAVEEQYYLLLPAMLFVLPARWRFGASAALVAASLAACLFLVQRSPSAAFYFLPTRAWELGIGSLAAFLLRREFQLPAASVLRWAGSIALVAIPALVDQRDHPGLPALAVCVATALVILAGPPRQTPGLLAPLAWIGDRSYSLYLVHWPVFAFANNIMIEPVPASVNLLLLPLVLGWTELQYRFVEQRWRGMAVNGKSIAVLACIPLALCSALSAWAARQAGMVETALRGQLGLGAACLARDHLPRDSACRSRPGATTLIWGDSFALPLAAGLAEVLPGGVVQATKPVCGPFTDIAPVNGAVRRLPWAEDCRAFNRSVLKYLEETPEIDTVILTSALTQYVPKADDIAWRLVSWQGETVQQGPLDEALLQRGLEKTLSEIRRIGRKAVFVAPPPMVEFDTSRCLRRLDLKLPTVLPTGDCSFSVVDYRAFREPVIAAVAAIRMAGAPVVSLDGAICDGTACKVRVDGTALYQDAAHLSGAGVALLAHRMLLPQLIERTKQ